MLFDLSTPNNQAYIQSIRSQVSNWEDLQGFDNFLAQYSVVDFTDPTLGQAAKKSCGGGNCCKVVITIEL